MTLILTKKKTVYDMPTLLRVALRTIYEPKKVTSLEYDMMMSSVNDWKKSLDARRDRFSAVDEENQICLEYIGNLLYEDSQGKYDKRKAMFADKGIDWRKFHSLPEAYKAVDFYNAQKELEKHKKQHPDYYQKGGN